MFNQAVAYCPFLFHHGTLFAKEHYRKKTLKDFKSAIKRIALKPSNMSNPDAIRICGIEDQNSKEDQHGKG
jgi:hypothetical protein